MTTETIIRAWRDEDFRLNLSAGQREALPANPAGLAELTNEDLKLVGGGTITRTVRVSSGMGGNERGFRHMRTSGYRVPKSIQARLRQQ